MEQEINISKSKNLYKGILRLVCENYKIDMPENTVEFLSHKDTSLRGQAACCFLGTISKLSDRSIKSILWMYNVSEEILKSVSMKWFIYYNHSGEIQENSDKICNEIRKVYCKVV